MRFVAEKKFKKIIFLKFVIYKKIWNTIRMSAGAETSCDILCLNSFGDKNE